MQCGDSRYTADYSQRIFYTSVDMAICKWPNQPTEKKQKKRREERMEKTHGIASIAKTTIEWWQTTLYTCVFGDHSSAANL